MGRVAVILVGLMLFWVFGGVAMGLAGGLLCAVAIVALAVGSSPRAGTWLLLLGMAVVSRTLGGGVTIAAVHEESIRLLAAVGGERG